MAFKHGESNNGTKTGLVVLGTEKPYHKIAPGKLSLHSTSDRDEPLSLIVKGVSLDNKGVSEFVSVHGKTPVQTKESFTHVNEVSVNSKNDNNGAIIVSDAAGDEVVRIKPSENVTNVCQLFLTKEQNIVAWGVGVEGDTQRNPHTAYLSLYKGDKRYILHTLVAPQERGEVDKWFKKLTVPQNASLVVEFISTGDEDKVRGWFEVEDIE